MYRARADKTNHYGLKKFNTELKLDFTTFQEYVHHAYNRGRVLACVRTL